MENNKKLELTLCGMWQYELEWMPIIVNRRCLNDKWNYVKEGFRTKLSLSQIEETFEYTNHEILKKNIYGKPLLHSLDKLTEPVLDAVIPIVELAKIENRERFSRIGEDYDFEFYDYSVKSRDFTHGVLFIDDEGEKVVFSYSENTKAFAYHLADKSKRQFIVWNQLELFEKLKEWHFNLFDLPSEMFIEKSEV